MPRTLGVHGLVYSCGPQQNRESVREPTSGVADRDDALNNRKWQLAEQTRWARATDVVGTAAVVVSLVYVGLQVRQNTAAIHTSTSQEVYQQYQEQSLLLMESAELAEIILRASQAAELTPVDSVRYDGYLNVMLNLYEAVYTNALQGTLEPEMATAWLAWLPDLVCTARLPAFWADAKETYHRAFRSAVDSVYAITPCPE